MECVIGVSYSIPGCAIMRPKLTFLFKKNFQRGSEDNISGHCLVIRKKSPFTHLFVVTYIKANVRMWLGSDSQLWDGSGL